MVLLAMLDNPVHSLLFGFIAGILFELVAILLAVWLIKILGSRSNNNKTVKTEGLPVKPSVVNHPAKDISSPVKNISFPTKNISFPVTTAQVEKPNMTIASVPVEQLPRFPFHQHYWYYVDGQEKPFKTLHDALKLFPEDYKVYENRRDLNYKLMPKHIQDNIRREKFVKED
jgi:hypothetical protein